MRFPDVVNHFFWMDSWCRRWGEGRGKRERRGETRSNLTRLGDVFSSTHQQRDILSCPLCYGSLLWSSAVETSFNFFISSSLWAPLISSDMLQEGNRCPEPYKGLVPFFLIWQLIDQSISICLNRIDVCGVPLAGRGVWAELVFARITIACYSREFIVVMTEPLQTESNQNVVTMIKIKGLKWWTGGEILCICGSVKEGKPSHKLLLLDCKVWSLSSKIDLCRCGLLCGWVGDFLSNKFLLRKAVHLYLTIAYANGESPKFSKT